MARSLAAHLPGAAAFVVAPDGPDLRYRLAGGEALEEAGFAPADLVGRTLAEGVGPELAAEYEPQYRGALERGEPFEKEHDSHGRSYITRGTPLYDTSSGRVEAVLVVSYDISERKEAMARQEFLLKLSDSLRPLTDPLEIQRTASRILRDQLGADRVAYAELDADEDTARLLAEDRADHLTPFAGLTYAWSDFDPIGHAEARQGRSFSRADVQAADDLTPTQKATFAAVGFRAFIMRLDDEAGALRGFAKVARDATEQKRAEEATEATLEAVAVANEELEGRVAERTAALAEMSQMRQELLRKLVTAQEEERGRISRDLHDDTGQQISALLLGIRLLRDRPTIVGDSGSQTALDQLADLATDVARKSHRLSFTLRPTELDDIGLMGALQHYAETWSTWSRLDSQVEGIGMAGTEGGGPRLPREIETTIYRIVQEALTNILKYAAGQGATRVTILVQQSANRIVTVIEDDGPGFDVEAVLSRPPGERRLGIFGMQERARLAGGTLEIESEPGAGTSVYLRLPLPPT